jgi:hypothetical protein
LGSNAVEGLQQRTGNERNDSSQQHYQQWLDESYDGSSSFDCKLILDARRVQQHRPESPALLSGCHETNCQV